MIRAVFDFVLDGIRGREVYWPKAPEPERAYIEAVTEWEGRMVAAHFATFECGCCIDAEAARLELIRIELYREDELLMQYPIDTKGEISGSR